MVVCNLVVLLAERGSNISKLSEETGLSRNTLSALAYNTWKGVQAETISAICMALQVDIADLFSFYPFKFEINACKCDMDTQEVVFDCVVTDKRNGKNQAELSGSFEFTDGSMESEPHIPSDSVSIDLTIHHEKDTKGQILFFQGYSALPHLAKQIIKQKIYAEFMQVATPLFREIGFSSFEMDIII